MIAVAATTTASTADAMRMRRFLRFSSGVSGISLSCGMTESPRPTLKRSERSSPRCPYGSAILGALTSQ